MSEKSKGILFVAGAYIIWGILPIYWRQIETVSPFEIIAHRIFWSFVFMVLYIMFTGRWQYLKTNLTFIFSNRKKALSLIAASIIISVNWLTYILAVNEGHILEAGLGYYINPFVSILLAFFILKERFSKGEWLAIFIVSLGVIYMALGVGHIPWLALTLAVTFGVYGLIKKTINIDATYALAVETAVLAPPALLYILYLNVSGVNTLDFGLNRDTVFTMGTGVVTAIPLLLFALGAIRIPLSLTGLLQYIGPTLMLIIGIFLYGEAFTDTHKIAYSFIWSGLIIYTLLRFKSSRPRRRPKGSIKLTGD
ncbi:chloramphenicol-sensitive protein RarD [Jeotgalicoccus coquinae]|uniref:Chloramphenicol-sensitive protein RarD n=1 Tax=Jeotgalicoccus coquinae TaxID=709509 RepID=A0A6V7RPD3_9STAP|nr:EamA family transporter RarD [Jeotgalicoccus coquinae]MBB6424008.1 chloramphenicol-sensitive protein RarD [Jeotgalicoccus coquinae]GGE23219.1 chloramphenicol-sensitive protein RarD [Jeotgalicoccus coquinae]CAD2080102.1 EamA-like transporter family protein [Jeotgalicoccus coquinae]